MSDEGLKRLLAVDAETLRLGRDAQRAAKAFAAPSAFAALRQTDETRKAMKRMLGENAISEIAAKMRVLDTSKFVDVANLKLAATAFGSVKTQSSFAELSKTVLGTSALPSPLFKQFEALRRDESFAKAFQAAVGPSFAGQARAAALALEALRLPKPYIGRLPDEIETLEPNVEAIEEPLAEALVLSETTEVAEVVESYFRVVDTLAEMERLELAEMLAPFILTLIIFVGALVQHQSRYESGLALMGVVVMLIPIYRRLTATDDDQPSS
jgi:hypothetical protein